MTDIKVHIGGSDIASLVFRFPGLAHVVNFGEDGEYYAHVTDENTPVPPYYTLEVAGWGWLTVYDDDGIGWKTEYGKRYARIEVYRAGEFGCLIRLCGEDGKTREDERT